MRTTALAPLLCVLLALAACGDDDDAGQVVQGSAYEVTVPEGWDDESEIGDEVEVGGISPELALAGKRADGFATNVNVIRGESPPVGLDEETRAERDLLRGAAQSVSPVERTTLDGHEARVHEFELVNDERTVRVRQVFARDDGWTYFVSYTALPQHFDEELDEFDAILRSWEWR